MLVFSGLTIYPLKNKTQDGNYADRIGGFTYKTDKLITELFCLSVETAVNEIERRRNDPDLIKRVEDYLQNDIPEHFSRSKPIFYFSRHLATPNYEVAHVIEMTKLYKYNLVVGEDHKGIFVSNNELKISLGKLPVVKGVSKTNDEIIENMTIIDFATSQGKAMDEISTKFGQSLPDFHHDLFKFVYPENPELVDESAWIDRNDRNNIVEQYKKILALLCVHGVMLESYVPEELKFVTEVVSPAFKTVERAIGVRPLIVEHISPELEVTRNWNSYPNNVYSFVKKKRNHNQTQLADYKQSGDTADR